MTYQALIEKFLHFISVIKALNPAYKQPGDGSNGVCDCIGLIIGAIRRMGLKWKGIHGSNYWARFNTVNLSYIAQESDLKKGDLVYKGCEPDGRVKLACNKGYKTHKYDLPDRYKRGGQHYTPNDQRDYYHVGAVTQVNPLRITHMTSPRMKVDTNLNGGWNYRGEALPIVQAATSGAPAETVKPDPIPETTPVATAGSKAVVVADSGTTVNMRKGAATSKPIIARAPVGQIVEILVPGEKWAEVKYGGKRGYMMAKFLDVIGDGKGKY